MKIVKVTYTTQPDYAAPNKENINVVMNDLQQMAVPGINYNVCLAPDECTFTHTAFFNTEEDQKVLFSLPSFRQFQEQLKASDPVSGPKQELLSLVGTSKNIF
jgi:hypothetical protein